jgi:hypothetical protein
MNWKKIAQTQIIITIVLLVCVVLRLGLMIDSVPGCCGLESPDGLYMALASNMADEDFWGNTRQYYKFDLQKKNGEVIEGIILESKTAQEQIQLKSSQKVIIWSQDSTEVTFALENIELKLKVSKKTGAEDNSHKL